MTKARMSTTSTLGGAEHARSVGLKEALAIVEAADPEELRKLEMAKAVEGIDFVAEAHAHSASTVSMAGQSPINSVIIQRQEASLAEANAQDQRRRAQLAASREELVRNLSAGQSPESQRLVRATISNGG